MDIRNNTVCRRAFTLTELLVAIALVLLLAAMLLPALKSAREFGRRASCLNNMRQLGLAINMYTDENRGKLPPFLYQVQGNVTGTNMSYQLSYKLKWSMSDVGPLRNPNILLCPSDQNPSIITTTDKSGNPITIRCSYAYNFEPLIQGVDLSRIKATDRLVLLFDGKPDQAIWSTWNGSDSTGTASADSSYALLKKGGGGGGGGGPTDIFPDCTPDADGKKVWICHKAKNSLHIAYPGLNGHQNHSDDTCGPCGGSVTDLDLMNDQLMDCRHFQKANLIFMDGHGEWKPDLSPGCITP